MGHGRLDGGAVADVTGEPLGGDAGRPQPLGRPLGPCAVEVGEEHPGALVGEAARGGLTDAAPGAGDHYRVAVEP